MSTTNLLLCPQNAKEAENWWNMMSSVVSFMMATTNLIENMCSLDNVKPSFKQLNLKPSKASQELGAINILNEEPVSIYRSQSQLDLISDIIDSFESIQPGSKPTRINSIEALKKVQTITKEILKKSPLTPEAAQAEESDPDLDLIQDEATFFPSNSLNELIMDINDTFDNFYPGLPLIATSRKINFNPPLKQNKEIELTPSFKRLGQEDKGIDGNQSCGNVFFTSSSILITNTYGKKMGYNVGVEMNPVMQNKITGMDEEQVLNVVDGFDSDVSGLRNKSDSYVTVDEYMDDYSAIEKLSLPKKLEVEKKTEENVSEHKGIDNLEKLREKKAKCLKKPVVKKKEKVMVPKMDSDDRCKKGEGQLKPRTIPRADMFGVPTTRSVMTKNWFASVKDTGGYKPKVAYNRPNIELGAAEKKSLEKTKLIRRNQPKASPSVLLNEQDFVKKKTRSKEVGKSPDRRTDRIPQILKELKDLEQKLGSKKLDYTGLTKKLRTFGERN